MTNLAESILGFFCTTFSAIGLQLCITSRIKVTLKLVMHVKIIKD
jgi:hypothetical protein